ncbi:tyrosine-type recombinase/integrase [Thermodesulfobacteriota bacterium]
MYKGYVKMWRKSLDSTIFAHEGLWKLFCLCLLRADHKGHDVTIPGILKPIKVESGQFISESEAFHLLKHAKKLKNGVYYPVILCALRTGMRIGEMQALMWDDIDIDKRQIEVRRSYRSGRMTDTKNHKRRRVDMTTHLAETLNTYRTTQKRAALKNGKPFSEFVFTGARGEILNQISFQNALNACTEKAKLRHIRTHGLRHSFATIRLMKGHNVGDVSYQLGHSSIKITYDVYTPIGCRASLNRK